MSSLTTSLIVRLVDQVTGPIRKMGEALKGFDMAANGGFGQRLNDAIQRNNAALAEAQGQMMGAIGGALALRGAFNATAGAAMSLEDKMADIAKVSGMSTDELKDFETILRNLARSEIPLAVEELADLTAAASQSGIANEDLEEFTKMVAQTAVAWDMAGGQAGEALAKIKTALGLTIDETRAYGDAINYLSDNTASSAQDLINFSRRVAADGKVAGFAAQEVLALGAAMISAGSTSEVAATSLRNVGRMLSRGDFGAKKAQVDAMRELGLAAEDVAKAMQVDASGTLLDVLERINEAEPHKKLALMSGIFGDEARALMPLLTNLDETRRSIEDVSDEMNYLGSVQKEFEVRSQTGSYAIQRFVNQLRDVAIVIGQSLLPGMKSLLAHTAPYIAALSDIIARHPNLVAGLPAATAGVIGFKIALAGLKFVGLLGKGGALSMLALGYNTVGVAAIGAAKAAQSMVAYQTALAGMAGTKLGGIGKVVAAMRGIALAVPGVSAMTGALTAVGAALGAISLPVAAGVAAAFAALAGAGVLLWKYWDRISSVLGGFFARLGEEFAPALAAAQPVFDAFGAVGEKIGEGFGIGLAKLKEFGDWIGSFFQREVLTDEQKAEWGRAGYDMADQMVNSVKAKIAELVEWFRGLPQMILDAIGKIDIGSAISNSFDLGIKPVTSVVHGAGGNDIHPVGTFPPLSGHRANGGNVWPGGSFLVGESEPEIFTPSTGGTVTPASKARAGSVSLTVNINGVVGDAREIAREARREMVDALRDLFDGAHSDSFARA